MVQCFWASIVEESTHPSIDSDRLFILLLCRTQNMKNQGSFNNNTFIIAITLGACGVAIGAFGAHGLQSIIDSNGRQSTWDTGIFYFWIHTIALLALGNGFRNNENRNILTRTLIVWICSMFLFSGSLFALALGAPSALGAITPIGGLGFILGWLLLIPLGKNNPTH